MSDLKDGGPAFPGDLRDYLAAHAPRMTDQWWKDSAGDGYSYADALAAWNYHYADAMLAERNKDDD